MEQKVVFYHILLHINILSTKCTDIIVYSLTVTKISFNCNFNEMYNK